VETQNKLTLQVAGAEEGEEGRLLLTRLHQNLNLFLLSDQTLGNQNPNLPFKENLKRGKRFGVLRELRNQHETLRIEQAQQGNKQKKPWMSIMKNCIMKNRQVLKER
jgi:hypothetical protein